MARLIGTARRGIGRRALLRGGGASLALWGLLPRHASAAPARDPRLLVVILRGGLDGLSLAAPVGDPGYAALRPGLAIARDGADAGLLLDGFFALNPHLPFLHRLYGRGQALIAHAVATPYRGRSHFDGQDMLELGLAGGSHAEVGWLNRALSALPAAGPAAPQRGLAMGAVVPLVMRGAAPVLSWIPHISEAPLAETTVMRLMDLYATVDPALGRAFAEGLAIERIGGGPPVTAAAAAGAPTPGTGPAARQLREFAEAADTAARFLVAPDGPRIGALSFNGWDTHAAEGVLQGQLANRLAALDGAFEHLHTGLGPAWTDTVVVAITEFGRTAQANGTAGTDHGTATVAILAGGAVKGGRVIADWPGLRPEQLFERRDLAPTRDLRTLLKGILRDHLGIPAGVLADTIFPESRDAAPLDGLVA